MRLTLHGHSGMGILLETSRNEGEYLDVLRDTTTGFG